MVKLSPFFLSQAPERKKVWASVMVNFQRMLRSRHVSCHPLAPQATSHLCSSRPSMPASPTCVQRENLGSCPEYASLQRHLSRILTQSELRNTPKVTVIGTKIISGITPDSYPKTLRSLLLLRYSQLDDMIPVIRGSSHATRSSPRSKRYNTPI